MGYDMYTVEQIDSAAEYDEPNYFRLNIWGMSKCRDVMYDLDLLADAQHGAFPESPSDEWVEEEDAAGAGDEWVAYYADLNALLASHPNRDDPRIPDFKFGSNDGWHVTEIECRAFVACARDGRADGRELPEWWDSWVAFVDHAASHGGFTVH